MTPLHDEPVEAGAEAVLQPGSSNLDPQQDLPAMSTIPHDRKFAESHEWHLLADDVVTIGITQFAVNELTDVTFVEMQEVGTTIEAGGAVGEVESVKATSEIFSVVGGEIIEVNTALEDDPALVNNDPFGAGWLCKIKVSDAAPLDDLLDAPTYEEKFPL